MTYNKSRCKKSVTDLYAFLAQLDRASGYGPEGRGFESSRTHNSEMCRNSNTNFDTFFFDFLWILKIQSTIIEKVVQFFKKEFGEMTEGSDFLDLLLEEYSNSFDIQRGFEIGPVKADAYGYFSTISEKYVLTPKANLWSIHGFEHILFLKKDSVTMKDVEDMRSLMSEYMAPQLVCKGGKYPEKDHMYTYLTFAVLCRQTPDEEAKKAIRSFRFDKGYLFSMRGHSEVRLVVADLNGKEVLTNPAGRSLRKMYVKAFAETEQGARGYNELFDPPEQR